MNCLHNRIKVAFDQKHKQVHKIGDVELIIPHEWMDTDDDGRIKTNTDGSTKWSENTNYLETKPQICIVLETNSKYPYKKGDRLFTHYMAYETAENGDITTYEGFIIADYIFCTLLPDGSYKMANEVYFAKQIYELEEKTAGGIYIPEIARKPKLTEVKLVHLPEKTPFKQNEVVVTIDRYNYPCEIDGEIYIMLRENEIVGRI